MKQNWKIARVIPTNGGYHFLWLALRKTAIPRVNCVRQLWVTAFLYIQTGSYVICMVSMFCFLQINLHLCLYYRSKVRQSSNKNESSK